MTKHSLASLLEAVCVWSGGGGGGDMLSSSPSSSVATPRGHSAPDCQRASRRAPAAWQCCLGRRGICYLPIMAAPMASSEPLTVGAGALLLLD